MRHSLLVQHLKFSSNEESFPTMDQDSLRASPLCHRFRVRAPLAFLCSGNPRPIGDRGREKLPKFAGETGFPSRTGNGMEKGMK